MRWFRGNLRSAAGLSLVETLAALFVFSVMTVGITPLLSGSLQGANTSRSLTIGKNVVLRAMERVRELPYYLRTQNAAAQSLRVDVLDLYFPTAAGAAADGSFTTMCTGASGEPPGCPPTGELPAGYTLTFVAQFVQPTNTVPESYVVVAPPPGYAWDATATQQDVPPTRLVRMTVTARWPVTTGTKQFTLTTIVGDRKAASEKILATARTDYVIRVGAAYVDTLGRVSTLVATSGTSDSRIESRLLAQADQSTSAGDALLAGVGGDTSPAGNRRIAAATTILHAPPNQDPAAGTTSGAITMTHPDLALDVAYIGPSKTKDLRVKYTGDLPLATGTFEVTDATTLFFWVQNQANTTEGAVLGLDPLGKVVSVRPVGSGQPITGITSTVSDSIASTDRLVADASGRLGQVDLFPVTFIGGAEAEGDKAVVVIKNFQSAVRCESTLTGLAPTATYSATLRYWVEKAPNDGAQAGQYRTLGLAGTNTTDPLKELQKAIADDPTTVNPETTKADGTLEIDNPMVKEDPLSVSAEGSELDVYLFGPLQHVHTVGGITVTHNHQGYIQTWASLIGLDTAPAGSVEGGGRVTRRSLEGAIQIGTRPSDPARTETAMSVQLGKLSCETADRR